MILQIPIAKIAASAECIDGLDMAKVYRYRVQLRNGKIPPDVLVRVKNRHGYYFLEDGYHRVLAAVLEGHTHVRGDIYGGSDTPVQLSWRWPRFLPFLSLASADLVKHT